MSIQWRDSVRRITPYIPSESSESLQRTYGLARVIKLASNENPLGPSPKAVAAMQAELAQANAYPDARPDALYERIAFEHGVDPDWVIAGNGADHVISTIGAAYLNPGDEVLYCVPTFSSYQPTTVAASAKPVELPLTAAGQYNLAAISNHVTARTKLIFICNPNNPTGRLLASAEIEQLLQSLPTHVLVALDEAYIDFVDDPGRTGVDFVKSGYPVIAIRTFSKIYGLAGMRVGYAIARPDILQPLHTVREPYAVNRIALVGALAALDDHDFVKQVKRANQEGLALFETFARQLDLTLTPSVANFVLVDLHRDAGQVYAALRERGILVRPGANWGLPTSVRITIGTTEQLQALFHQLEVILSTQAAR